MYFSNIMENSIWGSIKKTSIYKIFYSPFSHLFVKRFYYYLQYLHHGTRERAEDFQLLIKTVWKDFKSLYF